MTDEQLIQHLKRISDKTPREKWRLSKDGMCVVKDSKASLRLLVAHMFDSRFALFGSTFDPDTIAWLVELAERGLRNGDGDG